MIRLSEHEEDSKHLREYLTEAFIFMNHYEWISNSYVAEFFTQDLWRKLPPSWRDCLEKTPLSEVACNVLKFSQNKLYTRVWPLSLLSFVATCHALALNRQQTKLEEKGVLPRGSHMASQMEMNVSSPQSSTTTPTQEPKVTRMLIPSQQPNAIPPCQSNDVPSQMSKGTPLLGTDVTPSQWSNIFKKHIKPKKRHELSLLPELIHNLCMRTGTTNIVDVGSGLGHLARFLAYKYGYNVTAIEMTTQRLPVAEKFDREMAAELQRIGINRVEEFGTVTHIARRIDADISSADFCSLINTADNTNCVLIGLHTCGDLASTMLKVFRNTPSICGIVSVSCCYFRMTLRDESLSCCEDTMVYTNDSVNEHSDSIMLRDKSEPVSLCDTSEPVSLCDTSEPVSLCDTSESVSLCDTSEPVSLCDTSEPVSLCDTSEPVSLCDTFEPVSLCDKSEPVSLYDKSEPVSLCDMSESVSLCDTSRLASLYNDFSLRSLYTLLTGVNNSCHNSTQNSEEEKPDENHTPSCRCEFLQKSDSNHGFPLSNFVHHMPRQPLKYKSFETACHFIDDYSQKLFDDSPNLKLHCYRAIMEVLLRKIDPALVLTAVRCKKIKNAASMSFSEYAENVIRRVKKDFRSSMLTLIDCDGLLSQWRSVAIYHSLALLLGPVIESIALVDKWLFLLESNSHVTLVPLFDPKISPRNFVVIATK